MNDMASVRLTWKRQARESGLRAVGALERGWELRIDGERIGGVSPLTKQWDRDTIGWFWVTPADDVRGIGYMNTCNVVIKDPEDARNACEDSVRKSMGLPACKVKKAVKP